MLITLKQVGEYGQLSRGARTAGWTLMILAAVCLFIGGFLAFLSTSRFSQQLEQEDIAPEQIRQMVGEITRSLGGSQWLFWTAGALVVLSLACFLFGRRTPPVVPGSQP